MKDRIAVVITLNVILLLLFGGSCVYAGEVGAAIGEITPSSAYISVLGDDEKFAEDHWIRKNETYGVTDFTLLKEYKNGDSIEFEGRALPNNHDYLFNFDFERKEVGKINFEFKQFRKYYDGTGGYYQFAPRGLASVEFWEIGRDLFMDIGSLKIEGVLEKENCPKCTVSYEREYRKGAKSLTSWGIVTVPAAISAITSPKILPTFLEIDEIVDKVHMKIERTVKGVDISAEQTWEKIRIQSQKSSNRTFNLITNAYSSIRYKYEDLDSDIYTTVVRIAKELNEKVFVSTAFLYNHNRGHTIETITDTAVSTSNENNPNNPATVDQDTVTVLPKLSFTPFEHMLMDAGLRWEYVKTNGAAEYDLDRNANNMPDGIIDEFVRIKTEIGENKIGENFNLRYDGIKNTVFYAGAEIEQQIREINESSYDFGRIYSSTSNFSRDTYAYCYDYTYTGGLKWYPVSKVDITTEFKYRYGIWDYSDGSKESNKGDIINGYRGFLDALSFTSYKPMIMVNLRPHKRLSCSFRYTLDTMTYGVRTPRAVATEPATYLANIYSSSLTFTPCDPLYMTLFYQMKQASTKTMANGDDGGTLNQPTYDANVNTLSASCGYSPVKNITIRGSYSLSKTDNFNDFSAIGLPLGLDNLLHSASLGFENKITNNCTLDLRYDFSQYNEKSNDGMDDYISHLFYVSLKAQF